jgi:mono/diheme cytochrome c family protein
MTSCASRACMNSERWPSTLALLGALWPGAGCADFSRGKPLAAANSDSPDASATGGGAGSSFAADILPLLLGGCGSCHSPTGAASSTPLVFTGSAPDDYVFVFNLVDVDTPDASRLLVKAQGRGHGGGAIYTSTSSQYAAVLRWIGEGAPP